jgi:hypothetical protein
LAGGVGGHLLLDVASHADLLSGWQARTRHRFAYPDPVFAAYLMVQQNAQHAQQ